MGTSFNTYGANIWAGEETRRSFNGNMLAMLSSFGAMNSTCEDNPETIRQQVELNSRMSTALKRGDRNLLETVFQEVRKSGLAERGFKYKPDEAKYKELKERHDSYL